MSEEQKTVFISYRRNVASFIARAIFMDLRDHGYDVFMDVESINAGQFDTIILNQIEARAHFLIILTPGTIERCAEPGDWLRREIEYAMHKQRNIVPLLVNDFRFAGTEHFLTDKLAELPRFNGIDVPHSYFEAAMERLRTRFLQQPVYVATKPAPASDQPEVQRKIEEVSLQPAPTSTELRAEHFFHQAAEKINSHDFDGANADYTEAIRLNPQNALAYQNRGVMRHEKGDLDGAIADLSEAIHLNPQNTSAYQNRGVMHHEKGDLDHAIIDYDQAIRLNPQDADAYNSRGNARIAKGDLDGAIADYNEAIRLNPQDAIVYTDRGNLHREQGLYDSAIADYTEAIRLDPQFAGAYLNRGIARCSFNDFKGAIADLSEAIRLDPKMFAAYLYRAQAREIRGDMNGAIEDYQKFLDLGGGKKFGNEAQIKEHIRDLKKRPRL